MSQLNIRDFEAVAWDFDGVLSDIAAHTVARRQAYSYLAEVKNEPRYSAISDEVHEEAHFHGSNPHTINGWILEQVGIEDEGAVDEIVQQKERFYQEVAQTGLPAIPGALHLLRAISVDRPAKQALASTAKDWEVKPFLQRHKLHSYIPAHRLVLRGHPEVTNLKPAPDAYVAAGKLLGVACPENLLVIEDSEQGIEAAKRYGAFVVVVANTRSVERLTSIDGVHKPDLIFASTTALTIALGYAKAA